MRLRIVHFTNFKRCHSHSQSSCATVVVGQFAPLPLLPLLHHGGGGGGPGGGGGGPAGGGGGPLAKNSATSPAVGRPEASRHTIDCKSVGYHCAPSYHNDIQQHHCQSFLHTASRLFDVV